MAEGHSQGPGGGGRNVGHLRLRVHTWLQDTVLGVPVLMMFRREVGSHAGVFGLPLFESGFAPDGLILAEEFRCALRIWPDRDDAVSKIDFRPTQRIFTAEAIANQRPRMQRHSSGRTGVRSSAARLSIASHRRRSDRSGRLDEEPPSLPGG